MSRGRWVISVGILTATGLLLWRVPALSGYLYGPVESEPTPLITVVVVVGTTAVLGFLSRRLPGWARGAICAVGSAIVLLVWPYRDFSSLGWVALWTIYSGALLVGVVGGFLFGLLLPPRLGSGDPGRVRKARDADHERD